MCGHDQAGPAPAKDQEAGVMQERYCSCGGAVGVEYKLASLRPWEAKYWQNKEQGRRLVSCCVQCGRKLDIHSLR